MVLITAAKRRKLLLWFLTIPLIWSFLYTYTKIFNETKCATTTIKSLYDSSNFDTIIDETKTRKETSSSLSLSSTTAADATTFNNDNNVIIGAGFGTTGTHLMYYATCHMGYKSVHFHDGCIELSNDNDNNIQQTFNIHNKLISKIQTLSRCLKSNFTTSKQELCGNAIVWKQSIETIIDQLVLDTRVVAFHDWPYPYFVDTFVESIKKYNKTPIVLLSERSPTEWFKRRIETNGIFDDIMCKESVLLDSTDDTTTTTTTRTLSNGFDLLGCINNAIINANNAAGNKNDNNNLDLKDIFVSLRYVSNNPESRKIMYIPHNIVMNEVQRYQDHVNGQLSNFTYNMFTQINKTEVSELADMILNEIPILRKNSGTKVTPVEIDESLWITNLTN